jgi:hypothetical protein
LTTNQLGTNHTVRRNRAHRSGHCAPANLDTRVDAVDSNAVVVKTEFNCFGYPRHRFDIAWIQPSSENTEGDAPIHRPCVEIAQPEARCDRSTDRALASARWTINGNHHTVG